MRKILSKYSFVCFFFFIGSFVMIVNAQPPPDVIKCCEENFLGPNGEETPEYNDCLQNEGASCVDVLPINNSIYVYISIVAGVAVGGYVIVRKITHKKTPI